MVATAEVMAGGRQVREGSDPSARSVGARRCPVAERQHLGVYLDGGSELIIARRHRQRRKCRTYLDVSWRATVRDFVRVRTFAAGDEVKPVLENRLCADGSECR